MRLHFLHLDDALELQPDFLKASREFSPRSVQLKPEGALVRLWGRLTELDALKSKLAHNLSLDKNNAPMFFMGSGDFHHVTPILIDLALTQAKVPVTVIHFDNHPDWVHFKNGVHCGSWVNRALENPLVEKIITIGVCSSDLNWPEWKSANLSLMQSGQLELYPYEHSPSRVRGKYGARAGYRQEGKHIHWNNMAAQNAEDFAAFLRTRTKTDAIYITVDKDVLESKHASTNWDQGQLSLLNLLALLEAVAQDRHIIGADVVGDFSRPVYAGSLSRKFMKKSEIMIDQPFRRQDVGFASELNSAVNLQLLYAFSRLMPT